MGLFHTNVILFRISWIDPLQGNDNLVLWGLHSIDAMKISIQFVNKHF